MSKLAGITGWSGLVKERAVASVVIWGCGIDGFGLAPVCAALLRYRSLSMQTNASVGAERQPIQLCPRQVTPMTILSDPPRLGDRRELGLILSKAGF
jgi:hypothetical protein